jgi:hypothetical protein
METCKAADIVRGAGRLHHGYRLDHMAREDLCKCNSSEGCSVHGHVVLCTHVLARQEMVGYVFRRTPDLLGLSKPLIKSENKVMWPHKGLTRFRHLHSIESLDSSTAHSEYIPPLQLPAIVHHTDSALEPHLDQQQAWILDHTTHISTIQRTWHSTESWPRDNVSSTPSSLAWSVTSRCTSSNVDLCDVQYEGLVICVMCQPGMVGDVTLNQQQCRPV